MAPVRQVLAVSFPLSAMQGAALSRLESATGMRGPLTPGEVAPIDRLALRSRSVSLVRRTSFLHMQTTLINERSRRMGHDMTGRDPGGQTKENTEKGTRHRKEETGHHATHFAPHAPRNLCTPLQMFFLSSSFPSPFPSSPPLPASSPLLPSSHPPRVSQVQDGRAAWRSHVGESFIDVPVCVFCLVVLQNRSTVKYCAGRNVFP